MDSLYDVLYAAKTGSGRPRASLYDNLFGKKLYDKYAWEEKTIDFAPVISVNDAIAGNALDYQFKITAMQSGSGDPSPINIRDITGRTGANIGRTTHNLIFKTIDGAGINSDGKIMAGASYKMLVARIERGKTYQYSIDGVSKLAIRGIYTSVPSLGSESYNGIRYSTGTSFTALIDGYVAIRASINETKSQIEVGDEVTAYETPTIYPVSWQSEAGEIFGGLLNATTGALSSVYVPKIYNGTESGWGTNSLGNGYYISLGSHNYDPENSVICNCLLGMNAGSSSGLPVNGIRMNGNLQNLLIRVDTATDFPTVDDWKYFLTQNPMMVLFPLAEPLTYTLTPTEIPLAEGANTIWSDTGDSKLTYKAKKEA